jgi:thiol-disulfide isomerase/thioredoxin
MKTIKILLWCTFIYFSLNASAQPKQTLQNRMEALQKEKDPIKGEKSLYRIIKEFKLDPIKYAEETDVMKGGLALSFLEQGNVVKFEKYIRLIRNKFNQTSYLNMAVANLSAKNLHMDYALALAERTVNVYTSYKDDPKARPTNFPIEDWNRFMRLASYPYYESYALILHNNGQDTKALMFEEMALKDQDLEQVLQSSLALYTKLLIADKQDDKAYKILLKMASLGKTSLDMNINLKKLTVNKMGNETQAVKFLDSIQRSIGTRYKSDIAKKMIVDRVAPKLSLLNVDGVQVGIDDFIGKVVVLDFWATWCIPCIASMRAMKEVQTRHPEVAFIFIATQETGKDSSLRVKNYLKNAGYPSNSLIDVQSGKDGEQFKVAAAYGISAIPTKIIIDQKGKIRFSTSGYTSDTELINELEAMIYLATAQ